MKPVPPQSRRKSDPSDPGYKARAGSLAYNFLHLLENGTRRIDEPSDETITQGLHDYVADVLDQYACQYYADEDPLLIGRVIDRLSQMYELLIKANLPHIDPEPGTIEGVFDDIYALDGEAFCAKYNISDFYEMLRNHPEAEAPKDDYCALAHHLSPADPAAGFAEIDTLILSNLRFRQSIYNWQKIARLAVAVLIFAATIFGTMPLVADILLEGAAREELPAFVTWFAHLGITGWQSLLLIAASFPLAMGLFGLADLVERRRLRQREGQVLPPGISQWLNDNNKRHSLEYWHEIHWPSIKRELHRSGFLGFAFYRKTSIAIGDYEAIAKRRILRRGYDYRTHLIAQLAADMKEACR